jgi:hypothetical protein
MNNIIFASQGDKIKTKSGRIYEFVKLKRTKFIAKNDEGTYDIPVELFDEIIEKAPPKKLNQTYKKLQSGDLFYCIIKDDIVIFSFVEIANGRIIGKNLTHGGRTRIDISLYGGNLAELKKLNRDSLA